MRPRLGKYKRTKELEERISSGFLSGKSNARVAREIRDRFGVAFRDAERLVRTETSYIAGQADLQAYRDLGIEAYEFITALDSRTCKHCAPLDGQVFPVRDARVGKNYPLIHPNCRCTTGMADERLATGYRRGKDADGGNVLLPEDMNYAEWQEWQLSGAPMDVRKWRKGAHDTSLMASIDNGIISVRNTPANGTMSNKAARAWYLRMDKKIPSMIDYSKPLEDQARQAFELRNTFRAKTRDLMQDQALRKELDIRYPNKTFEELLDSKMRGKRMSYEEALRDIIQTASKTNAKVNKDLGVDDN